MELIPKQIYITQEQDEIVKQLAQRQGKTEAEILSKAIDQFLAWEGVKEIRDPFADMIGIFEGLTETDHNDIYR